MTSSSSRAVENFLFDNTASRPPVVATEAACSDLLRAYRTRIVVESVSSGEDGGAYEVIRSQQNCKRNRGDGFSIVLFGLW